MKKYVKIFLTHILEGMGSAPSSMHLSIMRSIAMFMRLQPARAHRSLKAARISGQSLI